jgi:hypothetical protein
MQIKKLVRNKILEWFYDDILKSLEVQEKALEIALENNHQLKQKNDKLKLELKHWTDLANDIKHCEEVFRKNSGLPPIEFYNVSKNGQLDHPIKNLTAEARLKYLAEMSDVYKNEKFQTEIKHAINYFGNYSFQIVEEAEKMMHGRWAVLGIRNILKRFEEAHNEYMASREPEEKFDENAILSE